MLLRENQVFTNIGIYCTCVHEVFVISFIEELKFVQDGETPHHVMTLALKVKRNLHNSLQKTFCLFISYSKLFVIAITLVPFLLSNWLELIGIVIRI